MEEIETVLNEFALKNVFQNALDARQYCRSLKALRVTASTLRMKLSEVNEEFMRMNWKIIFKKEFYHEINDICVSQVELVFFHNKYRMYLHEYEFYVFPYNCIRILILKPI